MSSTPRCEAKTRAGHPCRNPAGFRTPTPGYGRCWLHGGNTPNGRTAAAREAARAQAGKLGAEASLDAGEALELAIRLVGGEVDYLRLKVAELEEGIDGDNLHPLVRALGSAVERLARIGKLGIDAGIEERRLELDEVVVERLTEAVRAALAEVDLSAEQQAQLRESMTRHLATLNELDLRPVRRELPA